VQSGVIGRETIHFLAVPGSRLEAELDLFINWFNKSRGAMDGLLRAGITHFWLVTLHPFEDGNGRVTRALTDMAIAQDEGRPDSLFRMSSRILEVRKEYYAALQAGQAFGNGQDLTPWLGWFLHQAEMACAGAEQTIRRTLAKARFWATHREDPVNERQRKVLNALLDAGPGGVVGGLTTGKYRGMAKASPATAFRDINDLLAAGCIVQNPGGGRSTSYDIPWESLFA
jgi:Fic family protein